MEIFDFQTSLITLVKVAARYMLTINKELNNMNNHKCIFT